MSKLVIAGHPRILPGCTKPVAIFIAGIPYLCSAFPSISTRKIVQQFSHFDICGPSSGSTFLIECSYDLSLSLHCISIDSLILPVTGTELMSEVQIFRCIGPRLSTINITCCYSILIKKFISFIVLNACDLSDVCSISFIILCSYQPRPCRVNPGNLFNLCGIQLAAS